MSDKPNILIIWGDDIGWFNISAYNHGMMGYRTPNIDRVANEGAMFTDWYGQQSCTAGRFGFTWSHMVAAGIGHPEIEHTRKSSRKAPKAICCFTSKLALPSSGFHWTKVLLPIGHVRPYCRAVSNVPIQIQG